MATEPANGDVMPVPDEQSPKIDDLFFSRQIRMPGLGRSGQGKLAESSVLIMGAGALGCPVATAMVGAGVGSVTVADGDRVERRNLHRQTAYCLQDEGRYKAECLAEYLSQRCPEPDVRFFNEFIAPESMNRIVDTSLRLVVDCCDNFASRFALHDYCRDHSIDLIQASVQNFSGSLLFFEFSRHAQPCLGCLYPAVPHEGCVGSCAQDGILGATAQIIASAASQEAIRHLSGMKPMTHARHMLFNLENFEVFKLQLPRSPNCPAGVRGDLPGTSPVHSRNTEVAEPAVAGEPAAVEEPAAVAEPAVAGEPADQTAGHSDGAEILDIRNPWEYREIDDRLAPSRLKIPMDELVNGSDVLDKYRPYAVICESGIRSAKLLDILKNRGFTAVYHIEGGFAALRSPMT